MSKQEKRPGAWIAPVVAAVVLAAVVIWAVSNKGPAEPAPTAQESQDLAEQQGPGGQDSQDPGATHEEQSDKVQQQFLSPEVPGRSLEQIIAGARTWKPAYREWYDKEAPDFTLTDIEGKKHQLSNYRGKEVLLVFWATWCPPCRMEIPDLIKLTDDIKRNGIEAAVLAISNQELTLVKPFVEAMKMNYTVLLEKGNMPEPFGVDRLYRRTGIPGSFFVDAKGKIKLATVGIVPFEDMKGILLAKSP